MAQRKTITRRQLAADLLEIAETLDRADVTAVYIARLWLRDLAKTLPAPHALDVVDAEDRGYHARLCLENRFGVTENQAVT